MINGAFPINKKFRLQEAGNFNSEMPTGVNVIANPGGGITVVTFETGQALPDHKAPGDVLVMVLEGAVVFNMVEDKIELGQGDCMLMPTGTIHNVKALAPSKVMLAKFAQ